MNPTQFLNVNLNLYRSFYYVAKYGGFSKASEYALISQPSLSTNIKNLEDSLNMKLFYRNRNHKNFVLTAEGKELFEKLEEIINIFSSAKPKEELNIGCARVIADNYLNDAIFAFKTKNKNIKISFNFDNTTELYQLLKKDEIDIIITRYPVFYRFDKNINVEKIIDIENVFVCSKEFYKKNKNLMQNKKYIYPMILPNNSEKRRIIEQFLIDFEINYTTEIELPNSNLLKEIILSGIGIGYINKKFVSKEIENGNLIELKQFHNIPLDNITIIHNLKRNNPILEEFIKTLKITIGKTNS